MKPNKAAVVVFLAAALTGPAGWAQDQAGAPAPTPQDRRPFGSLEKSLLVPGWGQLAEGRLFEGILFLGSEAFCLIEFLRNNHLGNENYAMYKAAADRDSAVRYRAGTERYDRRRNQFLLAGAAVWALNLLDISLIVKAKDRAKRAWTFGIGRNEHETFVVMAACRF